MIRLLGIVTTVAGDQATLTCGTDAVTIILNRYVDTSRIKGIFLLTQAVILTSKSTACTKSWARSSIWTVDMA